MGSGRDVLNAICGIQFGQSQPSNTSFETLDLIMPISFRS